jgi:hypothetical protein
MNTEEKIAKYVELHENLIEKLNPFIEAKEEIIKFAADLSHNDMKAISENKEALEISKKLGELSKKLE